MTPGIKKLYYNVFDMNPESYSGLPPGGRLYGPAAGPPLDKGRGGIAGEKPVLKSR